MTKIKTKGVDPIRIPEPQVQYKVVDASGNEVPNYHKNKLNTYQQFLFDRALKGITVYSADDIAKMNSKKKQRILNVSRRAHEIVNVWKQEKLIEETNDLMLKMFPKSKFVQEFLCDDLSKVDPGFKCKATFKSLGITKEDIIEKFKQEGVLPKDFDTLVDFY